MIIAHNNWIVKLFWWWSLIGISSHLKCKNWIYKNVKIEFFHTSTFNIWHFSALKKSLLFNNDGFSSKRILGWNMDETVCSAAHLSLNKCRTFHRQHILIYSTICQKRKNRCWQFEQNFEVWELSDVLCTAAPLMQFKCSLCHKSANVNITTSLIYLP